MQIKFYLPSSNLKEEKIELLQILALVFLFFANLNFKFESQKNSFFGFQMAIVREHVFELNFNKNQ